MTEGRHTVCQEVRAELAWEEWRDFRGMPADVSSRASERVLARINTQCRHSEPAGTSAASLGKCILRESLRLLTWFVTGSSGLEFLYTAACLQCTSQATRRLSQLGATSASLRKYPCVVPRACSRPERLSFFYRSDDLRCKTWAAVLGARTPCLCFPIRHAGGGKGARVVEERESKAERPSFLFGHS